MKKQFKIAAINATPVFLDLDATVTKAVGIIEDAASQGAEMIGFPEAFFPGYPIWLWSLTPEKWGTYNEMLWKNAVSVPGPQCARLSEAARKNNIYVCASVTELDGNSLYLTQLWFDNNGNLIGKHRKIRPTGPERCIWGEGEGSTMAVLDTDHGRVGGLHCWEHMMVINNLVMAGQHQQIHVASWGSSFWDPTSPHHWATYRMATKYYAMTIGCYAMLSATPMTQEFIDFVQDGAPQETWSPGCAGGGVIFNPDGQIIAEIDPDTEGIAIAEIDRDTIDMHHYQIDIAGHYSKPGVEKVVFDRRPQRAVNFIGEPSDYSIPYDQLQSVTAKDQRVSATE